MPRITIEVTDQQKQFLELLLHEDVGTNQSHAVQWCIDSCMKIEKLYGIDACYVSMNDIRLPENDPSK